MQRIERWTHLGFLLAGAYNVLGMLLFSRFFTNPYLAAVDPDVFSWLGQVAIILWGLAYWSVAGTYSRVPLLVSVFAIEKLVYGLTWSRWLVANASSLPTIAEDSLLTALFFAIYGLGDLIFCVFFTWVAWRTRCTARLL